MMRWLYKLPLRFRSLFRKQHVEKELTDELRFHLGKLTEEYVAKGMTLEEARYAALRELGGLEQVKEECRDTRRLNYIDNFLQDVRYGLRQLRRSPGFTAVVVLSLAIGIGANTAIFSLIDAVMMRMLPVRQPEQLILLNWVSKGYSYLIQGYDGSSYTDKTGRMTGTSFSYPIFEAIRARNSVFSDVLGFADADQPMNLNAAGLSGLAKGEYVSGNYFSTLGVSAALGRTILPSDDKTGAAPVAVISYAYWTSRFGRDSSVVGKAITVNGVPFTLVGVAAPEFWGLSPGVRPTPGYPSRRTCWWIRAGACRRTARSWRPTDRDTEHRRLQVTAGGLVFIGASYDGRFRAFNKDTGKELWVAKLPASGFATPMTFRARKSGKQYVVIAAGGGNKYDKHFSDALVAYALPRVALSTVEGTASGGKDREVIEGFTQVLTGSRSAWISPSFVVPGDE